MRKAIIKIYSTILVVGFSYFIWVRATGLAIPCLYYLTTGYLCPGCGVTRMFLSLARLDIAGAFSNNPVVFVLLIIWNIIVLLCFYGKIAFVKNRHFLYTMLALTVASLSIFAIVRNIP